ncbi:MAG: efflux RND transporter periplasmic adaptor subunit [Vicinamibacterales bacterium]
MRKTVIGVVLAVIAVAGFTVLTREGDTPTGAASAAVAAGGGRQGGRGTGRPPMPVEFAAAKRAALTERVFIVGNLIGAATVQAVPKINGRLQTVDVQLGDQVRRGELIAKVEDREIQEQVRQAEATNRVGEATIRQREADLKLAQTNLERNKSLLDRQLLPKQSFDDTEARYQAALAQLDLARAQFEQSKSRLEELKINLANTTIASPVDGFVAKRFLDPGAAVSPNVPVALLVDIRTVRMVANLVEKDMKRVSVGSHANIDVDAFPGETFDGRVSRVAPVFDPSTRTAEIEIEVPNPGFRLKPGMYARVQLTVASKADAIMVPSNALVRLDGKPGVFTVQGRSGGGTADVGRATPSDSKPQADAKGIGSSGAGDGDKTMTAKFVPVETGIRDGDAVEIVAGVRDGMRVITTGVGALKDGDRVIASTGADSGRPAAPAAVDGGAPQGTRK